MKNIYFIIAAVLILLMLTLPLLSLGSIEIKKPNTSSVSSLDNKVENSVIVLNTSTNQKEEMDLDDYIFGVVAAEMPMSYHDEAIKAQVIAAYTFLLYRKAENTDKDYDITLNSSTDQAFINAEEVKEKWGDKTEEYTSRLKSLLSDVDGMFIGYKSKPILAAYHAISSGKTENSKNVWGVSMPYLSSVESIGDLLAPDYLSTVTVSHQEFKNFFENICSLPKEKENYIEKISRSKSGTITNITIGGKNFTGSDLRSAFSLRSSNFDITIQEDDFIFTVRGYGHGVGMSQFGANYMAQQGNTFREILYWYYKGCTLEKS